MAANFSKIDNVLNKKFDKKKVKIRGWVYRKRTLKDKIFLVIRDSSDIIQVLASKGSKAWKDAQKITIESSLELEGKLREDKRAPTGFEINATKINIVGLAEDFPIARDTSPEFLMDVRHLAIRSRKLSAVFRIRSKIFYLLHRYMHEHGFYEMDPPMLSSAGSEGGAEMFKLKYFDTKTAVLNQSWQFYAEAFANVLEKVYCIAPSFRAEKSKTARHVTEYWHFEVEAAWMKMNDMMKLAEDIISYVCLNIVKENKKDLDILGKDPKELLNIKAPFPRITYKEAAKKLKIKYGNDFGIKEERALMKAYKKPLFITHYPSSLMHFYKKRDPKNPKVCLNFNMISPFVGDEIIDGSERESDLNKIIEILKKEGKDPKQVDWYLDSRRYGAVPHSGFGLGIARLIMWICGLDHIRDTIPFPRTVNRISP